MDTSVPFRKFVPLEASATTTQASSPWEVAYVVLLSNDGSDSITFNIGTGNFTLKPGEKLQDIMVAAENLSYTANSGTQPFRAWGVK